MLRVLSIRSGFGAHCAMILTQVFTGIMTGASAKFEKPSLGGGDQKNTDVVTAD